MQWAKRSLEEVLILFAPSAEARLAGYLMRAGFADGSPQVLRLIAFKEEALLELWGWARNWRPMRRYPVLAASGGPCPKLKEGDWPVPEGRYPLTLS